MQGTVTAHDVVKRKVLVVYEDGDKEQMTVASLKHFLVPDDPLTGRGNAPVQASQRATAPSVPAMPPSARAPVAAPQPVPEGQSRDTAANHAQAAATMASWAPGGSRAAGAAAEPRLPPPPLQSQANGLPARLAAATAWEMKPLAQTDPVEEQPAEQRPAALAQVPQLPAAGSSPGSSPMRQAFPGQAVDAVAADGLGDSAAAEDESQRLTAAALPNGVALIASICHGFLLATDHPHSWVNMHT